MVKMGSSGEGVEAEAIGNSGKTDTLMEERGDAPVPPSPPEIWITSAPAFATPHATVPMPIIDTSLTEILALGLMAFKSKISCAKSSMV